MLKELRNVVMIESRLNNLMKNRANFNDLDLFEDVKMGYWTLLQKRRCEFRNKYFYSPLRKEKKYIRQYKLCCKYLGVNYADAI